jgi:putative transposase
MFIAILEIAVERFGLEIHAYCLMPNHYHLLVRSPQGQLSRSMKFIGQSYTQRFNRRHDRDGALFRGRFHSILVDSDRYLDVVGRYIHRNPVTKAMIEDRVLETFEWSSLRAYTTSVRAPAWLSTDQVLHRFRTPLEYEAFVRNPERQSIGGFYDDPFRQRSVLGDQDFVDRVRKLLPSGGGSPRAGAPTTGSDPGS